MAAAAAAGEEAPAAAAGRSAAGGGASPDSYIGSLISLTSKSEIRYEGVLYSINTEESSIGLRNVRSFGTEGRKKDGPQVPASDKIYEYILFRGSDIKDLQVKSSPPVPQSTSLHNDPAIIQSHYSHPATASSSLPSAGSETVADLSSQTAQSGTQRPSFQGNLPLYQPGSNVASWNSSPAQQSANFSGLAMPPMYWQGYYAPPSGFPQLPQPSLLRPPPGLAIPQPLPQPLQYPGLNASLPSGIQNLPEFPSSLQLGSTNLSLASGTSQFVPSLSVSSLTSTSAPESLASQLPNKSACTSVSVPSASQLPNMSMTASVSVPSLGSTLPLVSPLTSNIEPSMSMPQGMPSFGSNKPVAVPGPTLTYQATSQPVSTDVPSSSLVDGEASIPLVTPGQLLQTTSSTAPSSQPLQASKKDKEVKQQETNAKSLLSEPLLPDPLVSAPSETKEPLLPAPKPIAQKPVGASSYVQYNNRGRGRGRASWYSRPVTKFTEDFDFMAMNEKFNKDEVWGHLGKSKAQSRDDLNDCGAYDAPEDDEADTTKTEVKPVYIKDDFFDSLSCNTTGRGGWNGRTRFSEQMKIDTETFGNFPRPRTMGMRGGGRGPRGGGGLRGRGSYYGSGYGYMGRGRGYSYPNYQS